MRIPPPLSPLSCIDARGNPPRSAQAQGQRAITAKPNWPTANWPTVDIETPSALSQIFFRSKKKLPASSQLRNKPFPVRRQKASKSLGAPGSVAITRSTWPLLRPASAFLALRRGNGQFNPLASSSTSNSFISATLRAPAPMVGTGRGDTVAESPPILNHTARLPKS